MIAAVRKWVAFAVALLCGVNGMFVLFLIRNFDPKQNNPYFATDAVRPSSPEDQEYDCNVVAQRMETLYHPWEYNQLRRSTMMDHPSCMDDERIFSIFANVFQARILEKKHKQYNLHIPKTGGTSLCDLAKQSHMNVPLDNCHIDQARPYWCCVGTLSPTQQRLVTCDELQSWGYDLIANERWLDYNKTEASNNTSPYFCDELQYSITIRDPVERAMSHMNMYFEKFVCWNKTLVQGANLTELRTKQVHIIQSNYMTWSLVSGSSNDPTTFHVGPEHLELAKQVLSGFDFILDIIGSYQEECLEFVLDRMGFSFTKMPHSRVARIKDYARLYDTRLYEMLNGADIELYEYAQELIRLDCEFFGQIKAHEENELHAL